MRFGVSQSENGQILVLTLGATAVVLLLLVALLSFVTFQYRTVRRSAGVAQAFSIAEAGVDHAIRELNKDSSYTGEAGTNFGDGEFTVEISGSGLSRTITATGSIPDETAPRYQKIVRVEAEVSTDDVQFFYGIQVDEGGLSMNNNAQVVGNIYSNGDVSGGNGANVTGDATVAGGASPLLNQSQENTNATQEVGRTTSQADVAQSFIPSQSNVLRKVGVHLGKVGTPGNLLLRVVSDNNNEPSRTELAATTINAASVGGATGWIEVSLPSAPNVSAGTRFWIILDGTQNSENYYLWSKDSAASYTAGKPMAAPNWDTGNPSWSDLSGDLAFRVYLGGVTTKIDNVDILGNARANTLKDLLVGKDAYFQVLINTTVGGTQFPTSPDSPREELPISDGVIGDWKNDAAAGGVIVGPYKLTNGQSATLGPKKIEGDLEIDNLSTLTVTGTLWVTGNVKLSNNCVIRLDLGYGTNSGVIVTDGTATISNNCLFLGAGPGSHVMLLATKDAKVDISIVVDNNSVGVIYYAGKTRIEMKNNAAANSLTAWGIKLDNNATITYDVGLINAKFSAGPGGGWGVKVGTWQELK